MSMRERGFVNLVGLGLGCGGGDNRTVLVMVMGWYGNGDARSMQKRLYSARSV